MKDIMFPFLDDAVQRVKSAEALAPAGSHEHARYVAAALMTEWPIIKAYVSAEKHQQEKCRSLDIPSEITPNQARS